MFPALGYKEGGAGRFRRSFRSHIRFHGCAAVYRDSKPGKAGRLSGRGMLILVALSLYFGLTSSGVDNFAHIGGLICGFLFSVLLYRRKKGAGSSRIRIMADIRPEE